MANGSSFKLVPEIFSHAPSFSGHFQTFWHSICSNDLLCFNCPSLGITPFANELWFLLVENDTKNESGCWRAGYAHCYLDDIVDVLDVSLRWLSLSPHRARINVCTYTHPPSDRNFPSSFFTTVQDSIVWSTIVYSAAVLWIGI